MSEQQAKKLNLPLYLNPVVCEADRVAMIELQQWYEKARLSCSDRTELDGVIRAFHHDLYLAGLRLYLFDPRLCRQVAEALEEQDLGIEALAGQLQARGLWPAALTAQPGQAGQSAFSAAQLAQLEQLLAGAPPRAQSGEAPEGVSSGVEADALTKQLVEQNGKLAAMQAELKALRALAEEQNQQLRLLKLAAPAAPKREAAGKSADAEELDVSDMSAQIKKMKKVRGKGVF